MNRRYATAGVALSLALLGVGCDSFLSGPGLNENPNNPLDASAIARFVAVQASTFTRLEGQVARFAGIYTQQLIGSNNQQQLQGTQYGVSELDVSGFMSGFYTGGGLFGLRQVQEMAIDADNAFLEGIAKVWEAYSMGTATSVWGDLPYSEAVTPGITSPKARCATRHLPRGAGAARRGHRAHQRRCRDGQLHPRRWRSRLLCHGNAPSNPEGALDRRGQHAEGTLPASPGGEGRRRALHGGDHGGQPRDQRGGDHAVPGHPRPGAR